MKIKKKSRFLFIKRGFKKSCPVCGNKSIFISYIKLVNKCSSCNTNFTKFKTDDGPAYCTIFVVGHLIIPCILFLERLSSPPPLWFQLVFWPILTIILSIWLLPKMKGAFLAFQISVDDTSS
tara:strand:+ start:526 stop:891 length:366 start_codon:yes stop_codon:yes gene_type:complete